MDSEEIQAWQERIIDALDCCPFCYQHVWQQAEKLSEDDLARIVGGSELE